MRRNSSHARGFTLLELMIASGIGVVVLAAGLVAGMQMQRRALFEEQTMLAQVTGRVLKDMLTTDLQRAGLGMGNAPITFADGDNRLAIQSWTEPDLQQGVLPAFPADSGFRLPPANTAYTNLKSDALRLYWGDISSMVVMARCNNGTSIRPGNSDTDIFCTAENPPTDMEPAPSQPPTPAIIVNPTANVACHVQVSGISVSSQRINANPGSNNIETGSGPCSKRPTDEEKKVWQDDSWMTMGTLSAAYRVNWASGAPVLEYLPPNSSTWRELSRDVERLKIRAAVINLTQPNLAYRWFPDAVAGNPEIDRCTRTNTQCTVDAERSLGEQDVTDEDRRNLLRRRVRELEVILTIRTKRADRDTIDPSAPVTAVDDEGFPRDGFKRRTFTFRVAPRNFAAAGQIPPTGT